MRVNTTQSDGLCQLSCPDCPEKYIGQSDRPFATRVKENVLSLQNCSNSKFAQHLLHDEHAIMILDRIRIVLHIIKVNNITTIGNIRDKTNGLKINKCTVGVNALLDIVIQLKTQITSSA